MPASELQIVLEMASGVTGPPYDMEGAQKLCSPLERILETKLDADSSWSKWDWLDGFIAQWLERQPTVVLIRGAVWVNARRPEPCEVELRLEERCGVTIRFMDAAGPSTATKLERITFPPERAWRYVFNLPDRDSAV
jgi:hypothetical protein